jgi:hypothetical protein
VELSGKVDRNWWLTTPMKQYSKDQSEVTKKIDKMKLQHEKMVKFTNQ